MSETLQNAIYCGPTCKFISVGILGQFAWHSYVAHLADAAQQCAQETQVTLGFLVYALVLMISATVHGNLPLIELPANVCCGLPVIQLGAKRVHSFDHSDLTFNLWDYFQFNQNMLKYTYQCQNYKI